MTGLHHLTLDDPYLALQLVGTVAFAVSGAAVAIRARMDWLGIAVLAVVTEAYWHPRQAPGSLRLVLVADAAGLAVFTVTGTVRLLAIRYSWSLPLIPSRAPRDPDRTGEA